MEVGDQLFKTRYQKIHVTLIRNVQKEDIALQCLQGLK